MTKQGRLREQIYMCIREDDVKGLKHAILALNPVNVNFSSDGRLYPLATVAQIGKTEMIKVLLSFNANPNMHDVIHGGTALHAAAIWLQNDAIKLLLDAGADVNAVNNAGYTPLHLSLHMQLYKMRSDLSPGCLAEMVELLLKNGADAFITPKDTKETAFTCVLKNVKDNPQVIEAFKRHCPNDKILDAWASTKIT